jgi:hypothetical protein
MTGFPPLLRQIRDLTVALFAVLFLAGPAMDSLLCAADGFPAPAASIQAKAAVTDAGARVLHQHGESDNACQHGHAHAAPAFPQMQTPCAAPYGAVFAVLRPPSTPLPPSIAGPGLDRPPRA